MGLRITLAIFILIIMFPALAAAKNGDHLSDFGVRMRAAATYGQIDYRSLGGGGTTPVNKRGFDFGGRLELEKWLDPWVGMHVEGELLSGATGIDLAQGNRGKTLAYSYGAAAAMVKLLGTGSPDDTEIVGFLGASLHVHHVVHGYSGTPYYDTVIARTTGVFTGGRVRIALGKNFMIDAGGHIVPFVALTNVNRAVIEFRPSHSIGVRAALEKRFAGGIGLGFGGYMERTTLSYRSAPDAPAEVIEFNLIAPIVYFDFSF